MVNLCDGSHSANPKLLTNLRLPTITCLELPLRSSYYILHQHLHRDRSSLFPIHCGYILLKNSHLLHTVRRPSISALPLLRKPRTCLLPKLLQTQADGKLRWHLLSPSHHHILFPRFHCGTLPLGLWLPNYHHHSDQPIGLSDKRGLLFSFFT